MHATVARISPSSDRYFPRMSSSSAVEGAVIRDPCPPAGRLWNALTILSCSTAEADNDVDDSRDSGRTGAFSLNVSTAGARHGGCSILGRAAVEIPFVRCSPCQSASASTAAGSRRDRRDANAKPAGCLDRSHPIDLRSAGAVRDAMRIGSAAGLRDGRRHGSVRIGLPR